jgi:hypothetical protein
LDFGLLATSTTVITTPLLLLAVPGRLPAPIVHKAVEGLVNLNLAALLMMVATPSRLVEGPGGWI